MTPDALMHKPWVPLVGLGCAAGGYALAMFGCFLMSVIRDGHVKSVLVAMERCGWSRKEFAAKLGITPARFSKFLSGESPLAVDRLWALPEMFQVQYDAARAALRGARVLEPEEIRLIHGFAAMDRPHMLRMTQASVKVEEVA